MKNIIAGVALITGLSMLMVAKTAFAAPTTPGTIERSQKILQEDKELRQRMEQKEKFFVEKIIVKGALKLSEHEIKDVIAPFKGQWLTEEDIRQIIDSLKAAYKKKGIKNSHLKITYEFKETRILEIALNELTQ